ncbi:MAG: iron-sulfur cluster-binding protein [Phycisphaeraceae bacterium]|nr:iron-sulfur cluster-binding protein [Phycisphaeraceae bacterium]
MTDSAHDILFPPLPYDMHARTRTAVRDVQLQQFVNNATRKKVDDRRQALLDVFGDRLEAARALAGQIKQHTLDHLDFYVQQFVESATATGVQVHFAADAAQANAIAIDIAQKRGCKLCVKSKSMATEEIALLPALEAAGIETIETDLAEFILQIDHDAPSHIVTAMIHKDRTAVGRAFQRVLGVDYCEDPTELTMIARKHLREKFRQADLGISGGNFLVADTGSLVLCTNEGNGRMCTSMPRTHIAFVGIEKLVPNMKHLAVMLKLLARSSTGQHMTCYTHIITGPRKENECDGPEQLHIVLLDNGRTRVLEAETREMLRCIRCGACLNACPVYRKAGGHAYGSVYCGPIGAILTPVMKLAENYPDLAHASSLCGACYEVCPVKINIPEQLIRQRRVMVQTKITGWRERFLMRAWAWSLKHSWTYRLGMAMQKLLLRSRDGYLRQGMGPLKNWTDVRDMPSPAKRNFRQWWRDEQRN